MLYNAHVVRGTTCFDACYKESYTNQCSKQDKLDKITREWM